MGIKSFLQGKKISPSSHALALTLPPKGKRQFK